MGAVGMTIGILVALASSRWIASLLYNVPPNDPAAQWDQPPILETCVRTFTSK